MVWPSSAVNKFYRDGPWRYICHLSYPRSYIESLLAKFRQVSFRREGIVIGYPAVNKQMAVTQSGRFKVIDSNDGGTYKLSAFRPDNKCRNWITRGISEIEAIRYSGTHGKRIDPRVYGNSRGRPTVFPQCPDSHRGIYTYTSLIGCNESENLNALRVYERPLTDNIVGIQGSWWVEGMRSRPPQWK
jgi:hypothetical protein